MKTASTFEKANSSFEFAKQELMRPEEDVVLLSACHAVKESIRGYLTGFLELNKVAFSKDENIESLMAKCSKTDLHFSHFDTSKMSCKCDHGDCIGKSYCLTMEQVKNCMSLVADLGNFVATGK